MEKLADYVKKWQYICCVSFVEEVK